MCSFMYWYLLRTSDEKDSARFEESLNLNGSIFYTL